VLKAELVGVVAVVTKSMPKFTLLGATYPIRGPPVTADELSKSVVGYTAAAPDVKGRPFRAAGDELAVEG
jgi:hypothetical protein